MNVTQRIRQVFFLMLACVAAGSYPASAHEYYGKGFTLIHPWSDASAEGARQATIYFSIENISVDDRLTAARALWAEAVELRTGSDGPGLVQALAFEAGPDRQFVPGGPHLLVRGLSIPLQWGRSYPMVFVFEKSGPMHVMVSVGAH